jgi:phage I-like protein
VFRKTGSETEAFKQAYGAIKMDASGSQTSTPITCFASSVFPDWDAAAVYQVQIMRSGLWRDHPEYGDIAISNADLATAVRNFRSSSLKPFLDYNHAISDREVKPGDKEAIGWMSDMWIETLDGTRLEPADAEKSKERVLVLKAEYEVNADANEQIKQKKYAFFSPTWYSEYQNSETGELQGLTIIGGAATNIPFFTGMQGFVALVADRSQVKAMQDMLPKASMCVVSPADMEAADAVASLNAMGYKVDSFCPDQWGNDEFSIRSVDGGDMASMIGALEDAGFEVESFYQGYVESSKKIVDEVVMKVEEAAKQGELTKVGDALAKAAEEKAAKEAKEVQSKWDAEHKVIEVGITISR